MIYEYSKSVKQICCRVFTISSNDNEQINKDSLYYFYFNYTLLVSLVMFYKFSRLQHAGARKVNKDCRRGEGLYQLVFVVDHKTLQLETSLNSNVDSCWVEFASFYRPRWFGNSCLNSICGFLYLFFCLTFQY